MTVLRRSLAVVLPLLLAFSPSFSTQTVLEAPAAPQVQLSDGPYVMWEKREATIYRIYESKLEVEHLKGSFDLPLPGLAAVPLRLSPKAPTIASAIFEKPEKILAVSDVHGQFSSLLHLLQAQKVIDERLRWIFGRGHLVIVGDVMDRGPQVTEAYWFLRALEAAASRAGGHVHVLLGNHESLVLTGDYSYFNPKYAMVHPKLPPNTELYGPRSELCRWLLRRHTLVKLGHFLFVHGGPSPEFMAKNLSLDQANENIRKALRAKRLPTETKEPFLLSNDSPLWYRGLLPGDNWSLSTEADIAKILKTYHVRAIIVGHTPQKHVSSFHGGKVYGINTDLQDGNSGEAWVWEKGRIWRGIADGTRVAVESGP